MIHRGQWVGVTLGLGVSMVLDYKSRGSMVKRSGK